MTRLRWITAGVFGVLVVFGIVLALALGDDPTAARSPLLGKPAPAFSLRSFDGAPLRLSDLQGKVVVVNWWTEWCIPCIEEQPRLNQLADAIAGDSGVAMVGLVHDERSERDARQFARDQHVTYPLAFDPSGHVALDWGVTQQPETFVLAPDGTVAAWVAGPISVDDTIGVVTQMLGRPLAGATTSSTSAATP